jgi:hypothetical protein
MTVIAQQKPDLSGEWILSLQASMLSPLSLLPCGVVFCGSSTASRGS